MSSSTKKKHVMAEVLGEFSLPGEAESIVRVLGGRGNNLHLVEDAFGGEQFLVSMPKKFRRSVWIISGSGMVVPPSTAAITTSSRPNAASCSSVGT